MKGSFVLNIGLGFRAKNDSIHEKQTKIKSKTLNVKLENYYNDVNVG